MTAEENSSQRETISQTPKSSTRTFVNPGVLPIQSMPSIKEMLKMSGSAPNAETPAPETSAEVAVEEKPAVAPEPETEPLAQAEPAPVSDDIEYEESIDEVTGEKDDDEDDNDYTSDSSDEVVDDKSENNTEEQKEDFTVCWHQLFETLFSENHLIYYSLKDETPRYENDVIHIEVKNGIQKELIETNKTAILEYWRNHFGLNVDDLEVAANEQKEAKKVIVNSEDKMRNMAEQNDQLMDFLNILKFNIKD